MGAKRKKSSGKSPAASPETAGVDREQPEARAIGSLSDLVADDRNANLGTERGKALILDSLSRLGAGRSVLADRNGKLIAGNKTVEAALAAGLADVLVVKTDGKQIVVVQRTDLDLDQDKEARELAIVDNRAGQLSLTWDHDALTELGQEFNLELNALGFTGDELDKLKPAEEPADTEQREEIGEKFEVVVECKNEAEQQATFDKLVADGLVCRVHTI